MSDIIWEADFIRKLGKTCILFSLPEQQHYSPEELQQTPATAISPELNKIVAWCKEQQTLQAKYDWVHNYAASQRIPFAP